MSNSAVILTNSQPIREDTYEYFYTFIICLLLVSQFLAPWTELLLRSVGYRCRVSTCESTYSRSICKGVSVSKMYFPQGFIQLVLAQGTIHRYSYCCRKYSGNNSWWGEVRRRWMQISVNILDHGTVAEILVLNEFSDPNIAKVVYAHTSHL